MTSISGFGNLRAEVVAEAAYKFGTPLYLYDERVVIGKCKEVLKMPNAFGIHPRYAMKANSNKALLQLIAQQGFNIDASSLNEARRARDAGIDFNKILLTTQEVPLGHDRKDLEEMIRSGMEYNVCSLRQLELISDFASENRIHLSIRVHPGVGSGESATRNTGDKYSCFGVHLNDVPQALKIAEEKDLAFERVHTHIGSGGDPIKWRENIDRALGFVEEYFPFASFINFGGGLKEARMHDETSANIRELGIYAKERINDFFKKTGRTLIMEVEPGTYIVANSGYIVTKVIDKKSTGEDGFDFLVLDGGMELNSRPLLYGSRHPLYVVSKDGMLLSSERITNISPHEEGFHCVVGRCCESGDSQSLDEHGHIIERKIAKPEIGDFLVIGGAGAYCSSMAPFNYNSHTQAPEVLLRTNGRLKEIRKAQALNQVTENEISLD